MILNVLTFNIKLKFLEYNIKPLKLKGVMFSALVLLAFPFSGSNAFPGIIAQSVPNNSTLGAMRSSERFPKAKALETFLDKTIVFRVRVKNAEGKLTGALWYGPGDDPFRQYVDTVKGSRHEAVFERRYTFTNTGDYSIHAQALATDGGVSEVAVWRIKVTGMKTAPAPNSLPQINYQYPQKDTEILLEVGDKMVFKVKALDLDENLRGSEWYGAGDDGVVVRGASMNGREDVFKRQYIFEKTGYYQIKVMAFDACENGYSKEVAWNVTVSPPKINYKFPSHGPIIISKDATLDFQIIAEDNSGTLHGVAWSGPGINHMQFIDELGENPGASATFSFSHTFESAGKIQLSAVAFNKSDATSAPVDWLVDVIESGDQRPGQDYIRVLKNHTIWFYVNADNPARRPDGVKWYIQDHLHQTQKFLERDNVATGSMVSNAYYLFNKLGKFDMQAIAYNATGEAWMVGSWQIEVKARRRGLYVDGFENILGQRIQEDRLLRFVTVNDFSYLILYDLHKLWHERKALERFMRYARKYSRNLEIGAAGENRLFFDRVKAYNQSVDASARINILNLEYEYWNQSPSAFESFLEVLKHMRKLADQDVSYKMKVEVYLGKVTAEEAGAIAPLVDRVLLDAYCKDASYYQRIIGRFQDFAALGRLVEIWPIFSAEARFSGSKIFAALEKAENSLLQAYQDDSDWLKYDASLLGFQYFSYGNR
jgi:hypothetical protein